MKKFLTLIMLVFICVFTFACGGSSGDSSPPEIMTQIIKDGTSVSDEPSASLVESDVVEITCDENAITEGGYMLVSCLDENGDSQIGVYLVCDAGSIGVYIDDDNNWLVSDTCVKIYCTEGGENAQINACDTIY